MGVELHIQQIWRAQTIFELHVDRDWLYAQLNSVRGLSIEPFQKFDNGAAKWRDLWQITIEAGYEDDVRNRYEEVEEKLAHLRKCLDDYCTGRAMYEQLGWANRASEEE